MTEEKMIQNEFVSTDAEKVYGDFENVKDTGRTGPVSQEKAMFELEFDVQFGDCTFGTEEDLVKFLKTLTETQLRDTEVLEDDDTFVVFYPLVTKRVDTSRKTPRSGYHFDTDAPRPTVHSDEVPELVGILAEQFRLPGEGRQGDGKSETMREMFAAISI